MLLLGISLHVHHTSPGLPLPSFVATPLCYKLTHHSPLKCHEAVTLLLSQDVPNHFGHAERRIFMLKNAVFLLLIVDRCQSDCLFHNQWLHFILVQFKEYMMGLKCVRRSYHSQIEQTGVGWQVHMLDMLYTRSANRT